RIYGELLSELGFDVESVDHVAAAEPLSRTPRLVIADVCAMQSLEASSVERLKGLTANETLGIVFLIPPGQVELAERCREFGLNHWLVKPFKKMELADIVRSAMGDSTDDNAAEAAQKSKEIERTLRILVADDSNFNQQVAAGLLELKGHSVRL